MQFVRALSLSIFTFCLIYRGLAAQIPEGYEKGLSAISRKSILENISVLASDTMKGRPAGSREDLIAAGFIAGKFRQLGLKPLFNSAFTLAGKGFHKNSGTEDASDVSANGAPSLNEPYFQKFVIKKSRLSARNTLCLSRNLEQGSFSRSYKYKNDFLVQFPVPENIRVSAPVVFAGYGIDNGEDGYSDYLDKDGKALDVRNKIVVVVDGFPQERDTSSLFSKSRNVLYRNPLRKADLAKEKGAIALIVVTSPFKNEPPLSIKYEKMMHSFQRDIFCLPGQERKEIPVIYVSQKVLNDIFEGSPEKPDVLLEAIDKNLKAESFEFNKTISFELEFDEEILSTQNVVGVIEGSDPDLKNEFVVVGAHYDHIGLGQYGAGSRSSTGQIHNGADDNASGVSGLLEIAGAIAKCRAKRSVLFIAFSGEENGMLGSKYYVNQQPLKPLEKTVAMLNLDMISRNNKDELWIAGAFYSQDLIRIAERANREISMNLFYNTGLLTSASDQAPFLKKEIPSLFFFAGMHDDYHMPGDDTEKVDAEKAEKVSKLAFLTAWITGNETVNAAYKEVSMTERNEIIRESMSRQGKRESGK